MTVSLQRLTAISQNTGFRPEILEKVIRLIELLNALTAHPFLGSRLALKGGTALNLFVFNLPRLSVDIDLNYIGSADRTTMLADRPQILTAFEAICGQQNLTIRRSPGTTKHAGGKWSLRYTTQFGTGGNLEVDINFMHRVPLLPIQHSDSHSIDIYQAVRVPLLDTVELAAGKLCALLGRDASRDLFDAHRLLTQTKLDIHLLRLAFVVYGASQRKDWRAVSADEIQINTEDFHNKLLPVLRRDFLERTGPAEQFSAQLLTECRHKLQQLLPFRDHELEFLDRLLDHAEIKPELLTDNPDLVERIRQNPGLRWKALNVRKFKST